MAFVALTAVWLVGAALQAGAAQSLSVLTYNVAGNGAEDWSTNSAQVQALGRQMQYLQPDVIAFQEIPWTYTWQIPHFVRAFLPGYHYVTNSGGDGYIRSVILSRHPITRSQSWLNRSSLTGFGYDGVFTRDLFEAQIDVPDYPQPLHVFSAHLKAGTSGDDRARRAGEAAAVSNFLFTVFLPNNRHHPYVLAGDCNESDTNQLSIQRLTSAPTGLHLTTPVNPFSSGSQTLSIRGSLTRRYDYVMPCALLLPNLASSQVFRTDLLPGPPPPLLATDSRTASDHLPVLLVFASPYDQPFRLTSIERDGATVSLSWETVPGLPYRVTGSSNLSWWEALTGNLVATGYSATFDTTVASPPLFFRIQRAQ